MKKFKKYKVKTPIAFAILASLPFASLRAATPKSYVECLSNVGLSQIDEDITAEHLKDANSYVARFMGSILSKLPKAVEAEVLRIVGSVAKDIQSLKTQVADSGIAFEGEQLTSMNEKLNVAAKAYYAYHPYDDRYMVLLTPEGKLFEMLVSENGIGTEKVTKKFLVKDSVRSYYFSIHHDVKCKKNCDNFLWLVDSVTLGQEASIAVKTNDFPELATTELVGANAQELARIILEDEVKYGLAKIVGVEKAQKLAGNVVLPDPQDTSKYNREKFTQALKICERGLASSAKDKELLVQAIALLR